MLDVITSELTFTEIDLNCGDGHRTSAGKDLPRAMGEKFHSCVASMQTSSASSKSASESNRESFSDKGAVSTHIISNTSSVLKSDDDFNDNFRRAQEAIVAGFHPILIPEGTSGSYFIQDQDGSYLAVFKPKDEEPFAPLNPKWPKFFQRMLCFCCFGRACLIPNNGFISETAASMVDEKLMLNIVPKTRVVKLASPSFFYSRTFCCQAAGTLDYWPKEGSYQLFVHGYESAAKVLDRWDYDPSLLSELESDTFLKLFQKMCVLDYIIRNTDRHRDNWLIRHIPGKVIDLAAIDNGLAFPVKHPECASRFRQFPFQWANLKWAQQAWDPAFRAYLLKTITPRFVHDLCAGLKILLRHDHYNPNLAKNQLKVVRGQIHNLREALIHNYTPSEMSQLTPVLMSRKYKKEPHGDDMDENFILRPMDYHGRVCC